MTALSFAVRLLYDLIDSKLKSQVFNIKKGFQVIFKYDTTNYPFSFASHWQQYCCLKNIGIQYLGTKHLLLLQKEQPAL